MAQSNLVVSLINSQSQLQLTNRLVPYWKARFGAECVAAVVQGTLTSRAPKYSIILELDRKVRDMELPQYAQGAPPEGAGLSQTMSHFMPTNYRELSQFISIIYSTTSIESVTL